MKIPGTTPYFQLTINPQAQQYMKQALNYSTYLNRLRKGVSLILASGCILTSFAQNSSFQSPDPNRIALKNRSFIPATSSSLSTLPTAPSKQYVLLQFNAKVDQNELAKMQIDCNGRLNENTVYAELAGGTDLTQISGLRWAGKLQPTDRISNYCAQEFLANPTGKHMMVVEFVPNSNNATIGIRISSTGASIVSHPDMPANMRLVQGVKADFDQLAALEEVAWIGAASEGLKNGKKVHFCTFGKTGDPCDKPPFSTGTSDAATQRYETVSEGWDGPGRGCADLQYYIRNSTSDIPGTALEKETIERALAEWAKYAAVTFTEVFTINQTSTLDIRFETGSHLGHNFNPGELAHAYAPPPVIIEPATGDIHINDGFTFYVWDGTSSPSSVNYDLFTVVLHEIGHSLGMAHSEDPDAVMFSTPEAEKVFSELQIDDIAGILSLYAANLGEWQHGWVDPDWTSSEFNIDGDIEADPNGGQVRYRTSNGMMAHKYYSNGSWHTAHLAPDWSNSNKHVHADGDIAIVPNGQTFYRGDDNKVQMYRYSNSDWHHAYIEPDWNDNQHDVIGSIEAAPSGQVRYHARNDRMANLFWTSANGWTREYTAPPSAPATWDIYTQYTAGGTLYATGAIAVGPDGHTYYHGSDDRIQSFRRVNGVWAHAWIGPNPGFSTWHVKGDIEAANKVVYYHGVDDRLQAFEWSSSTGWQHRWILPTNDTNWDIAGDIEIAPSGDVRYLRPDGRIANLYRDANGDWQRSIMDHGYLTNALDMDGKMTIGTDGQTFYQGVDSKVNNQHYVVTNCPGKMAPIGHTDPTDEGQEFHAASKNDFGFAVAPYPNPFQDELNLVFENTEDLTVSIELFDLQGRLMLAHWNQHFLQAGKHQISLNTETLATGTYYVLLSAGSYEKTVKVVKTE